MSRPMSAEEADDRISEEGTRAIAERYGWDRTPQQRNAIVLLNPANDDGSVVRRSQEGKA